MFINGCINSETTKRVKVPYFAARMISKQMEATWLFSTARSKLSSTQPNKVQESDDEDEGGNDEQQLDDMMRTMMENKNFKSGKYHNNSKKTLFDWENFEIQMEGSLSLPLSFSNRQTWRAL